MSRELAGPNPRSHRILRWLRCSASLFALTLFAGCGSQQRNESYEPTSTLRREEPVGFSRAFTPRVFSFPQDHGAHPEFRDEWWYVTGNLESDDRRRFGFQITFFRHGLTTSPAQRPSHWAANQVFMAHFSITDAANQQFQAFERRARGALGLAGVQLAPFKVWLEDWRIQAQQGDDFPWEIIAREGDQALHLVMEREKPIVLQGEQGLSQKSKEPGNASYYYSATRLKAEGFVEVRGQPFPVHGFAWLDREWSTRALAPYQAGWDWFSLQFQDGTELMYYQLRHKDGQIDPYSSGSWIDSSGSKTHLEHHDVELLALDYWRAPDGVRYPARWRMTIKPLNKTLLIQPVAEDQELRVSVRYWEGAVDVFDAENPSRPIARGYMELTGYAGKKEG